MKLLLTQITAITTASACSPAVNAHSPKNGTRHQHHRLAPLRIALQATVRQGDAWKTHIVVTTLSAKADRPGARTAQNTKDIWLTGRISNSPYVSMNIDNNTIPTNEDHSILAVNIQDSSAIVPTEVYLFYSTVNRAVKIDRMSVSITQLLRNHAHISYCDYCWIRPKDSPRPSSQELDEWCNYNIPHFAQELRVDQITLRQISLRAQPAEVNDAFIDVILTRTGTLELNNIWHEGE